MSSIFMRFPEGKEKALTLSYDDGVEQDKRLIEIMQRYGLKGTFNLNSGCYAPEGTVYSKGELHRRMTKKQADVLYADSGMEVAVHGLTHPFLEQLPVPLCMKEIAEDRENLERQFERIVCGMAYPYGTYSDSVVSCLKNCGIVYARTVKATGEFGVPTDWLRLDPTCHHNDGRLMELAEKFVEQKAPRSPWLFYLWGHSYEFEQHDNWEVIEKFAAFTGNREDIWYATNLEICYYVTEFRRLVFSVDGTHVYNPSQTTLFFLRDKRLYRIKPGDNFIG